MMGDYSRYTTVSTHMPLARHDFLFFHTFLNLRVSTHMPLARHDLGGLGRFGCGRVFLLTCLLRGMTRRNGGTQRVVRFLLTCLLRGMTACTVSLPKKRKVSTHMPLARHDAICAQSPSALQFLLTCLLRGMTHSAYHVHGYNSVSTHMPLARHDIQNGNSFRGNSGFYSHASCEA